MTTGAAQLFVRPEKLTLSRAAPNSGNALAAVVQRASFLGSAVRYTVAAGPGLTMLVDTPNHSGALHPAIGDSVTVGWSAADSAILPA